MSYPQISPTSYNQSVERAFSIIELLANRGEAMRLMDIAQEVHLNISTTSRFLSTLEHLGYVAQNSNTLRYHLTFKLCSLSNKISENNSLRDIAGPYLRALAREIGESVCLAVEQNMQVVYIDVAEGQDQMIRSMQRIGNIAPMHCTGIGKLLLLDYTQEQIDQLIQAKGLPSFTSNTITDKSSLMAELKLIKQQNYAYDNEECEVGARCIAFPIRNYTGKIIGGFSVTGPTARLTDSMILSYMPKLQQLAADISSQLGYTKNPQNCM